MSWLARLRRFLLGADAPAAAPEPAAITRAPAPAPAPAQAAPAAPAEQATAEPVAPASTPEWLALCSPLVQAFEGCAKMVGGMVRPYQDTLARPPRWTRGYGRTYGITETSPPITKGVAVLELETGLTNYARRISALAPGLATRPAALAAVTSWSWNCGIGAFSASRLRRAINEGRWDDAAELIRKPNTAGGVVVRGLERRRSAECSMFRNGSVA